MRAAAHNNPNWPGTHLPRKIAPHRPPFLIHCPGLDTDLTCTKQTAGLISGNNILDSANVARARCAEERRTMSEDSWQHASLSR